MTAIATGLGINDFRSDLKPGDKLAFLTAEAAKGRKLLMVGDGLNDAPALAAAHVSMAPASASDIGRTAADFVFTSESLASVSFAYRVAKATGRIVKQNFALAIVYNLLAVPLAMSGHLNPLIAALAMSTSSIIVVANSLRLHLLKPDATDAVAAGADVRRFVPWPRRPSHDHAGCPDPRSPGPWCPGSGRLPVEPEIGAIRGSGRGGGAHPQG